MVVLRVADVDGTWTSVRLVTDIWKREPPRPFVRAGDQWELALDSLPVDRLEYQLEVERADGTSERIAVPGAPSIALPFGEISVLELDTYRAPPWLESTAPSGTLTPLELTSERLGATIAGLLWTAPGLDEGAPAPLIVALDGPEYARFASLDRYLASQITAGALPPLRAALLAPNARNDEYSASDAFADALARELVPAIERLAPVPHPAARLGIGASLGGLALLHARWRAPELFGALVLQSGSFFDVTLDGQEHHYRWFDRITAFVREVVASPPATAPIPIALTCGSGEENLANNRAMAQALSAQGHHVSFHEVRDAHTWTCWRDTFAPAFTALVRAGWPQLPEIA